MARICKGCTSDTSIQLNYISIELPLLIRQNVVDFTKPGEGGVVGVTGEGVEVSDDVVTLD